MFTAERSGMRHLSKYQKIEGALHLLFWLFIFTSVNVTWRSNWFDPSIRVNTPPPLSVIMLPVLFYAHAFWAMPKFLHRRRWVAYLLSLLAIFVGPEVIRVLFYAWVLDRPIQAEITGKDSFLVGTPDIAWKIFLLSFVYRLVADQIFYPGKKQKNSPPASRASAPTPTLPNEEAEQLSRDLARAMQEEQLFLKPELDLNTLSDHLNVSDKKLSAVLNQYLKTGFTDYVNGYRIRYFLSQVAAGQLEQLSIAGLATQCGFSSKPTFYRAFKKVKGCTPTEYLKALRENEAEA